MSGGEHTSVSVTYVTQLNRMYDVLDALPRILRVFQDNLCDLTEVKSVLLGQPPVPWDPPSNSSHFVDAVWRVVTQTLSS